MLIGVVGGGQLGRMIALAGIPLGMHFRFLDPAVVHRTLVLPRPGVISELYEARGVTESLLF